MPVRVQGVRDGHNIPRHPGLAQRDDGLEHEAAPGVVELVRPQVLDGQSRRRPRHERRADDRALRGDLRGAGVHVVHEITS